MSSCKTFVTTTLDLIIIEKPQLNFSQRLKAALKSQNIIAWFLGLFMIVSGLVYNNRVKGIILIVFGTSYLLFLSFRVFRIARTYIYKIEESESGATIHYLLNKKPTQLLISKNQNFIRTYDKSRHSLKQIHFLKENKTLLKQNAFGPWEEKDIENLEGELKLKGFKKPYGENL